jgi:sigma-B regulation protein RsbQ
MIRGARPDNRRHHTQDFAMPADILRRNNVKTFGRGAQPMLFVHGFGCDQHMWRFVTPAFAERYRIVLMDYVGSGKSDLHAYSPERYGTLQGYAEDILDVCAALDLRDVILVGHSVSGTTSILAALRAPERFAKLVLVCPSPRYIDDLPGYVGGFSSSDIKGLLDAMDMNYMGWATGMAPAIMGNDDQPDLGRELADSFCSTDPVIARRFAEATFLSDNRADLPHVRVPSLILQCRQDIIAPESVGRYMHSRLAGSTLALLDATGHCPHMSAPDETVRTILAYLDATAAPATDQGVRPLAPVA